jgi:hypothetical protein
LVGSTESSDGSADVKAWKASSADGIAGGGPEGSDVAVGSASSAENGPGGSSIGVAPERSRPGVGAGPGVGVPRSGGAGVGAGGGPIIGVGSGIGSGGGPIIGSGIDAGVGIGAGGGPIIGGGGPTWGCGGPGGGPIIGGGPCGTPIGAPLGAASGAWGTDGIGNEGNSAFMRWSSSSSLASASSARRIAPRTGTAVGVPLARRRLASSSRSDSGTQLGKPGI